MTPHQHLLQFRPYWFWSLVDAEEVFEVNNTACLWVALTLVNVQGLLNTNHHTFTYSHHTNMAFIIMLHTHRCQTGVLSDTVKEDWTPLMFKASLLLVGYWLDSLKEAIRQVSSTAMDPSAVIKTILLSSGRYWAAVVRYSALMSIQPPDGWKYR